MSKENDSDLTMPGSRVRDGHAATVLSILGRERMVPVQSQGKRFFMTGPFGWRVVAKNLAGGVRDPWVLCDRVSTETSGIPLSINVAQCDDDVPRRTYLALIGGACHESWHRLYSQQGRLTPQVIAKAIRPLTNAKVPVDLSKRSRLLLDFQNLFEDVAIERLGNAEFPGTHTKMCDLADFIVTMEAESRAAAGNPRFNLVSAVFVAMRDLGLGYNTFTIRENLAKVKRECPKGYAMVANGILTDILRRSIPDVSTPEARERAKKALLEGSSLSLALEALVLLEGAAAGEMDLPQAPPEKGGKGQKGAKSDAKADKSDPSEEPEKGESEGDAEGESDEGEGDSEGDEGEGESDGESDSDGDSDGDSEGNGDSDAESEGEGDGEGEGEGEDGESDSEGADGGGGESDSDGDGEGDGDDGGGDSDGGNGSDPGESTNSKDSGSAKGAGGGEGADAATAGDFLDQHADNGSGILDSNSALEQGVAAEEQKDAGTPQKRPYRPFSTSQDSIVRVTADPGKANAFAGIVREVRKSTTYLKTRLAVVFRALENTGTEHGVRVGRKVSGRMLVNTYCELRSDVAPSRPYMETTPVMDMSVAAAVVIDESSSMNDKLRESTAIVYTLMDALDCIGAKTMAVGFRSKGYTGMNVYDPDNIPTWCHRTEAMYYDIFKDWHERFSQAAPRLREIRAQGGTPMADGVEFALMELSKRPEGYRVMFVVTDGQPDGGHGPVIRSQMDRARAAGIMVVGVGLGHGSEHVRYTFDDYVYATKLDELPKALCAKLEELVRKYHALSKRGRAVSAA